MPQFEDKPQRPKKPSLLPTSPPATAAGGKIFAKLEHAGEAKPIFKRRSGWLRSSWVLGGLGILAVGAAIATYQSVTTPLHVPKAMDTAPDMSAKGRVITPGYSEPEPQGLAALIVNDPAGGDNPVTRNAPALAANPVVASAAPPPMLAQAPNQDNTRKLPRTESVAARQNTPALPQPVAPRRAESSVNTPRAPNPAPQSIKPGVVPAKPQTANTDRDVALLTALVAHGSPPPAQRSAPQTTRQAHPSPRTAENTPKGTKNVQSASAATAVKTREPNRDIVERNPNDTTDALLQRCKQLGFFEGEFCRWRICSGRWDSDAACKMPQSTSF